MLRARMPGIRYMVEGGRRKAYRENFKLLAFQIPSISTSQLLTFCPLLKAARSLVIILYKPYKRITILY
jgi:hypothetical protein